MIAEKTDSIQVGPSQISRRNLDEDDRRHRDWCHICGYRRRELAQFHYPPDAEHDGSGDLSHFVRICKACLCLALKVLK